MGDIEQVYEGEIVESKQAAPMENRFTKDRRATITEKVEAGLPLRTAAHAAGISAEVLNAWLSYGSEYPKTAMGRFATEVRKLEAAHEEKIHERFLHHAMTGTYKATESYVERRFRENWGTGSQGNTGVTVNFNLVDVINKANADRHDALPTGD